ncbi:hypothetical protein SD81_018735 [Tolypothrix campylonemoides VB511288]|nr:hypothetical protein SD81_018735 [Tolypothrix campylonemoides VB511288]
MTCTCAYAIATADHEFEAGDRLAPLLSRYKQEPTNIRKSDKLSTNTQNKLDFFNNTLPVYEKWTLW